ncbi:MAG TPA: hypothetical protein VGF25_21205 [Thermoleophilaceae bacterium]|jgi:hypothetical protein
MWDPELPASRGNAWESSPAAETTMPVSPNACLTLTPGAGAFSVRTVDAATVDATNLRMYGWAEKMIFGTSERVLHTVHRAAASDRTSVPRPRVPVIHKASATTRPCS